MAEVEMTTPLDITMGYAMIGIGVDVVGLVVVLARELVLWIRGK